MPGTVLGASTSSSPDTSSWWMIVTDPSANEETEFNNSHKAEEVVGEDANSGSL